MLQKSAGALGLIESKGDRQRMKLVHLSKFNRILIAAPFKTPLPSDFIPNAK